MNVRFKYSLNGVYRCENFAQHVTQNSFPRVPIGSTGGVNEWFITFLIKNDENNIPIVHPWVFADNKQTLRLRRFFNVPEKMGFSCFETWGSLTTTSRNGFQGEYMNIEDLLHENLDDDGALTVEYGIHVEGILGYEEIWKFNFDDQLFDGEGKSINWKLQIGMLHSHKQFFNSDASEVQVPNQFDIYAMKIFLQMAHGVRLNLDSYWLFRVIDIAHHYHCPNVKRYCEHQLIENYRTMITLKSTIRIATEKKLNRWMLHCLRSVRSVKNIDWDIENMTGEAMKMLAARIFELGE